MIVRVVLADDHAIVRDGLRAILQEHSDIEVVGDAEDGLELIRLARRLRPDVAVVDISMPRMNGISAIRRMREAGLATRAIVLSMHSTLEHVIDALSAGAQGYLVKHSVGADLIVAIRRVARGQRFLSDEVSGAIIQQHLSSRVVPTSAKEVEGHRLSPREREILQLTAEGQTAGMIAEMLHLSASTVYTYRSRMMAKLGAKSVADLIRLAIRTGVTPLE